MYRALALALTCLLVMGCGTAAPTTLPPSATATTTPATSPAPTAVPTLLPSMTPAPTTPTGVPLGDVAVVRPDRSDGAILNDVVVFRSRFIVGGNFGGPSDEARRAAVWSSADGLAWTSVPEDGDAFATTFPTYVGLPGAGGIGALAANDQTVVGVGGYGNGWGSGARAGAWYSTDGSDWHQAHVAGSKSAFMLDVSAGGPGFVAVGAASIPEVSPPTYAAGAIWTSVDGAAWSRVDTGTFFAKTIPTQVLRTDTGLLVALGIGKQALDFCSNCFGNHYLVWTSRDGVHWTRMRALPVGNLDDLDSFGVAGDQIIGLHDGSFLTTNDGATWTKLGTAPGDLGTRLLSTTTGALAMGRSISEDEDVPTVLAAWRWTATSGWSPPTPMAVDEPTRAVSGFGAGVAWGGSVVVVGGYDDERNNCSCYPVAVILRATLDE
jgi:hypothetical protein